MRVIGDDQIRQFSLRHPKARQPLKDWLALVKVVEWRNIIDLRAVFPSADGGVKGRYTVFNVKGNSYRLIAVVNYLVKRVDVVHVFTHEEYTKWSKL